MSNQDIFNYTVQYDNDPAFTEMKSISYYVLRMITFNFDKFLKLWKNNAKVDFRDDAPVFKHAGLFYNAIQVSNAVELFDDNTFYELCLTFKNNLSTSKKFSFLSAKFPDPIKCFIHFTKYFYIPVRIDFSSIPELKQKQFAKLWISVLGILLFAKTYSIKYASVIPTIDTYYEVIEALSSKEELIQALKTKTADTIKTFIEGKFDASHKTSIFYGTMAKLIYNMSIEIIRKWCPNYSEAKNINPSYDGSWLSPLDTDVNNQIKQIQTCNDSIFK